jgi:hypothetical protein
MPTVAPAKTFPFTRRFKEWRALKGQNDQVTKRLNELRVGLTPDGKARPSDDPQEGSILAAIKEFGEEIEGGHFVWSFPNPVEYTEGRKVHLYDSLKAERRLRPSAPTPDPELAEDLLREKGLFMTEEQEQHLAALRISCPNVIITVEPDVDALSALYLKKIISESEYESTLFEQREEWAFVPQEVK